LNQRFGGKNPEELPTVTGVPLKDPKDELTSKEVSSGEIVECTTPCNDKKGGNYIWWCSIEEHDIGLRIEWKGIKDKKTTIVVDNPKAIHHEGTFKATGKGSLKLIFKNTNSASQPKKVTYGLVLHDAELLKTNSVLEARAKKEKNRDSRVKVEEEKKQVQSVYRDN